MFEYIIMLFSILLIFRCFVYGYYVMCMIMKNKELDIIKNVSEWIKMSDLLL